MYRVDVSARIVTFPDRCACCMGRSDHYVPCHYTRVRGVRVIRYQVKSWDVPYCTACLDHHEAARHLIELQDRQRNTRQTGVGFLIGGFVAAAVAVLVLISTMTGGGEPAGSLGIFFVGAVLLAVGAAYMGTAHYQTPEIEHVAGELAMLLGPYCCARRQAVFYDGWHGTIHTFHFASRDYRDAFIAANRKKVL